jgi:nicotinate-nucleotide pyrophosphorylase (carboxylating)
VALKQNSEDIVDRTQQASAGLCWTPAVGRLIDLALDEDLGHGDVTTEVVGQLGTGVGRVFCREPIVACGLPVAGWVVERAEPDLQFDAQALEGTVLHAGSELARLVGPAAGILRVERTLLNFLMRMCGVATLTRRYVEAVEGTGARVVDTRKTMPGWRVLDKYAVRVGGGGNHRAHLGSGILIKDNHITACGSVGQAVRQAKRLAPHTLRVEVEVEDPAAVGEALEAGADVLLLDNMSPELVREVVKLVEGRALVEVSGGVNQATIRAFAEAGAQLISVGALTHSAPAVDLALDLEQR